MSQNENVLAMFFDEEEINIGAINENNFSVDTEEKESETSFDNSVENVLVGENVSVEDYVLDGEDVPVEDNVSVDEKVLPDVDSSESNEEAVEVTNNDEEEPSLFAQSDGQFSLFGDDPILSQPQEEEKEEKKSSASSSATKATSKAAASASTTPKIGASVPKKKPQDIEVDATWSIHYATNTFMVTDFINPMPASGKVNLEELRQEMEKEFFEMSKERTRWDYDETNKRLFPDVFGTSKGAR